MSIRNKSKKELEDEKKRMEEERAAQAYEEFVATFEDVPTQKGKVWVKAGTFDAGSRKEDNKDKGKLYKPTSKLQELAEKFSSAERAAQYNNKRDTPPSDRPDKPGKKKLDAKKKSNLELFKEELKMIQEERAERHRIKNMYQTRESGKNSRFAAPEPKSSSSNNDTNKGRGSNQAHRRAGDNPMVRQGTTLMVQGSSPSKNQIGPLVDDDPKIGSFDPGDPTTTNLYLGNLSPKITEQRLMELFGRYGPLASIKIMWPRTDDERSRGRNCGFVAYMNRKDGERALAALNAKDIDGFEMKLGWGKAVPIPLHPIYIPPALVELTLPPPPSGLPFNAQPDKRDRDSLPPVGAPPPTDQEGKEELEKILQRAVVKVVIPTERSLLQLIHRTIEFIIREGPIFEAMIMNREITNPDYRFLFENQSPAHVYYRWKIFSMLQGESPSRWSTKPFRMFKGGSIWKPPPLNPFLQGMPEELIRQEEIEDEKNKKGSLSNAQRGRLESMIRGLTLEREKIGEAMVWCIEHADAAEEICQCITESLTNIDTAPAKKIARLYLVSDVLHNCSVKVQNASFYRKGFQAKLAEIFEGLHIAYNAIESRLRAEQLKQRIMQCCRAWEDWAIYPHEFLIHLQNLFLGLVKRSSPWRVEEDEDIKPSIDGAPLAEDVDGIPIDDVDGVPLNNDEKEISDIDGLPLTTPLINKSAAISALMGYDDDDEDEDIDGAPLDEDVDGFPLKDGQALVETGTAPGFVSSKWESVSPKRVEAQAITTSKWEIIEANQSDAEGSGSDSTPVYDQPLSDKEVNNSAGNSPDYTNYQNTEMPPPSNEDDLDGIPLVYEDFKRRSKDSTDEDDDSQSQDNGSEYSEESRGLDRLQGSEAEEERRAKLREIEVRVMQYQDELEQGIRKVKPGYSISHQVQHFRRKLVKKIARDEGRHRRHRSRSASPVETPKRSRSKRSKSPHRVEETHESTNSSSKKSRRSPGISQKDEEIHESTNPSSKKSRGSPGRSQKWEKKERSQSRKSQHHNSDESRRDDSPKNAYAKREVLSTGKYKYERKENNEKEKIQEYKDDNKGSHRRSKSRSPRSHTPHTPSHRSRTPRKRISHSRSPSRKHKKKRH